MVGTSLVLLWFSSSHCCLAPSNWRRLFTQAFIAGVVLALTNTGRSANPTTATDAAVTTAFFDFVDMCVATPKSYATASR